jgi:hypothetical protein
MFAPRNIHKYTSTPPDGKTHKQTDHILIDRRWHSSILGVRNFRGADCDTDHYLVVAKFRESLAVGEQEAQKFEAEKFNPRKLNELEVRKQYHIKISNNFTALENLIDDEGINRAWENIKQNIEISTKDSMNCMN